MVIPNSLANYYAAKKQYPQIRCVGTPSEEVKRGIYRRVGTLFTHTLGNTLLVHMVNIFVISCIRINNNIFQDLLPIILLKNKACV